MERLSRLGIMDALVFIATIVALDLAEEYIRRRRRQSPARDMPEPDDDLVAGCND